LRTARHASANAPMSLPSNNRKQIFEFSGALLLAESFPKNL
jgi:hypothetical protein